MTHAGMILGTAAYMSPEQARGKPVDKRADIWAFGCVLYEMLTGRRTFEAEDISLTLAEVMKSEPDFDALPRDTPGGVRQALKLCLQKDPRQRGGDIAAIRLALEGAFETTGATVEASAVVAPAAPAWRRSAWPILAAVVVVAVVAGTAGWLFKPVQPPQIVSFDQELPDGTSFFSAGYASIAVSPDGRRVAYSTSDGVYLRSVDQLEPRLIPGTRPAENAVSDIMFSPDGEWIGFASSSALQLQKLSINGGVPVPLTAVTTAYAGGSWTSDNTIVFGQGQAVMRVSADGGTPETLFESTEGTANFPRMLPGGGFVSYTAALPAGPQTVVRALDGDEAETSFPGARAQYLPTGHVVYFQQGSLFAQPFDLASHRPTGGPVPLIEGVMNSGIAQFAVSPSGALAYIPGGAVSASFQVAPAIVGADGRVETLDDIPPGPYSSPRVSPDGTRVALQTTDGNTPFNALTARIWIYDLSGDTALRPLTQEGKSFHPIWTPDSQRLTFYSDRDGAPGVYWQPADGTGVPERLTTADQGLEHWPDAWSPDGRTLAYQIISPSSGMVDLWALDLDAPDEPRPLFARPERQHGAAFSPNGGWIAYGSTEGSPNAEQIYVEPFPPTGEKHQLTRESGAFPIWSPDGRSLFYRRNAQSTAGEEVTEFAQVDIVDGETFRWRNERPVPVGSFQIFGGLRDYDVLPDGRFVMLFRGNRSESGEAERLRINVVLNWVEELKARVPLS
jgi:serine/threonine-protein kinase